MNIVKNLLELFSYLSVRRRLQLLALSFLMILGAAAEMSTLGAAVPFLSLITNPNDYSINNTLFLSFVNIFGGNQQNYLLFASLSLGFIALIAGLIRILLLWFSLRVSMALGSDIGVDVYRKTLYRPYIWHVAKNSSEIIASLDKVNAVVFGIIIPLFQGMTAFIVGLGILGMLVFIDFKTAIVAGGAFITIYFFVSLFLKTPLVNAGNEVSINLSKRIKAVQEGVGGIRDILLDGTQELYVKRFLNCDLNMRAAQVKTNFISFSPRFFIESIALILIVGIAYWLSDGDSQGLSNAIPVLGILAIGGQKLLPQFQIVYASWSNVRSNQKQLSDVLSFIHSSSCSRSINTSLSSIGSKKLPPFNKPLIKIIDLFFRYNDSSPYVLKSINLEIFQGMHVGFIGKTGSGKSTLIDLIMGLLQPTSGRIEIDGTELNQLNVNFWQQRISHVPQSIYLADATIEENIAFGVPVNNIDIGRVIKSAKRAQLSEFIDDLPGRYKELVGERGVRLSGGQRQRIGLARSFYKHSDILILDEATSALDNETENSIMNCISEFGEDYTILMIAHRISSLKHCDIIIDLAEGTISRKDTFFNIFKQS